MTYFKKKLYCLGYLKKNTWTCISNEIIGEQGRILEYNIWKDGVYAVIFNPYPDLPL